MSDGRKAHGFGFQPAGRLLSQTIDLSGEMGIAYERSIGYYKEFHTHDRDLIVFPRGACRMSVSVADPKVTYKISSSDVLFVPKNAEHDDRGLSTVYDTVALLPSTNYMQQLIEENGLGKADGKVLATTCFRAKRSRWLDDLIDRYFFERVINRHSPKGCTFFLEKQMLNELARLMFSDKLATFGAILGDEDDDAIGQAIRYIESHLFEEVTLDDVAAAVKSTPSTLMRRFKKTLGMTVGSYIKDRRMDEAAAFIAKGDYQVGDVCSLVGYQDLSAFTRAFKAKFGIVPSMYRGSVKD